MMTGAASEAPVALPPLESSREEEERRARCERTGVQSRGRLAGTQRSFLLCHKAGPAVPRLRCGAARLPHLTRY